MRYILIALLLVVGCGESFIDAPTEVPTDLSFEVMEWTTADSIRIELLTASGVLLDTTTIGWNRMEIPVLTEDRLLTWKISGSDCDLKGVTRLHDGHNFFAIMIGGAK